MLGASAGFAILVGCATGGDSFPSVASRTEYASELARAGGFVPASASPDGVRGSDPNVRRGVRDAEGKAAELPVAAWIRESSRSRFLHVYLEGDGIAWKSRNRYADDPTPIDPVGLRLALEDPSDATIVYLGRPCQYSEREVPTRRTACRPIFWTNARYGEAVLDALDRRLGALIDERRPVGVRLVGYSGGGVLAVLLAARRDDIDSIVTVAAPLDLDAWTSLAGVTPLVLSINPMDRLAGLRGVKQDHFVGESDFVVPAAVTLRYVEALGSDSPATLHTFPGLGHTGWPEIWAQEALGVFDPPSP